MDSTQQKQQENSDTLQHYKELARNKKIGCAWLTGPIIGLVLVLIAYAIATFAASNISPEAVAAMRVINVVLGFLGILCVIGILIGIPLGIIYLLKKDLKEGVPYDERSGKGDASQVPTEIKGWNWGAAGLSIIWGIYHRVWISLIAFIPFVGSIWWIVMGVKGNEWAWRKNKWLSIEDFKKSQKKWMPCGVIFVILTVLSLLFYIFSSFSGYFA